ncbi:MAG: hypothetical protein WC805_01730 [Patescibacteria group bacterium]
MANMFDRVCKRRFRGETIPVEFIEPRDGFYHIWEVGPLSSVTNAGSTTKAKVMPTCLFVQKLGDLRIVSLFEDNKQQVGLFVQNDCADILISRSDQYYLWIVHEQLPNLVRKAPDGCLNDLELCEIATDVSGIEHPHILGCERCAWRVVSLIENVSATAEYIDWDAPPFV